MLGLVIEMLVYFWVYLPPTNKHKEFIKHYAIIQRTCYPGFFNARDPRKHRKLTLVLCLERFSFPAILNRILLSSKYRNHVDYHLV